MLPARFNTKAIALGSFGVDIDEDDGVESPKGVEIAVNFGVQGPNLRTIISVLGVMILKLLFERLVTLKLLLLWRVEGL